MKIIQVSSYYPPRIGGMQNVVREISERLANDGNEVIVYTSNIGLGKDRIRSSKNLTIRYCKGFEFANTAIVPGLFFAILHAPAKSIMHIHTPRPFVTEAAVLAARIRRIPYIIEVHSDIYPRGMFKFLIPIYKNICWGWVMRHAEKVIFLSHTQELNFRKQYGLSKTIVIPNGVDKRFYIEKPPNHKTAVPRLLSVGRLAEEKNLKLLIKVVSLLNTSVILDIVGEGKVRGDLETLIRSLDLESKVILWGKKNGDELVECYRNADVYVMASFYEGLSLAMLESMAASLPVVAFDSTGITEHIKNVGIIVKSHTPDAFAEEVESLIKNKKHMTELSVKSHDYAKNLAWPLIIERLEDLYRQTLSIEKTS